MRTIDSGFTICDNCPCLNSDMENGSSCNLEFTTDLHWVHFQSGQILKEHPGKLIQDYKLMNLSASCKLRMIQTEAFTFSPTKLYQYSPDETNS